MDLTRDIALLPKAALLNLVINLDIDTLDSLRDSDLTEFLNEPFVLSELAKARNLPVPKSFTWYLILARLAPLELAYYASSNGDLEVLQTVIKNEDSLDDEDLEGIILKAAVAGHIDVVRYMLPLGDYDLEEILRQTAMNGHVEIIELMSVQLKILAEGQSLTDLNGRVLSEDQRIPILESAGAAVMGGYLELFKLLLRYARETREKVDQMSDMLIYKQALVAAVRGGHLEIFNYLLTQNSYWEDILDDVLPFAVSGGNTTIVQILFDLGADNLETAIKKAARGNNPEMVKFLIEIYGIPDGLLPFLIVSADDDRIKKLLKEQDPKHKLYQKLDVLLGLGLELQAEYIRDLSFEYGLPIRPLFEFMTVIITSFELKPEKIAKMAAGKGNGKILSLAIGLDRYIRHEPIIASAVRYHQLGVIDFLLIRRGWRDFEAYIQYAARYGHTDIILSMIDKVEDLGEALTEASSKGHIEIVRLLIDHCNVNYGAVMASAALCGHKNITELILSLGRYKIELEHYNDALKYSSGNGHIEIVKMLLELGADDYDNAMVAAAETGHIAIVELMLSKGATSYRDALEVVLDNDDMNRLLSQFTS